MSESHDPVSEELLARYVPMSALAEHYLRELTAHAQLLDVAQGDAVTGVLSSVESIVFLVDGAVRFAGGGQPDSFLRAGEPVARFAIQGGEGADREAFAVEQTRLLQVDRAKVSTLLIWAEASGAPQVERDEEGLRRDITNLLMNSRLFERIPPGNIARIGELFEPVAHAEGDVVVRQGEPGGHYYIIESGRCEVVREAEDGSGPVSLAFLEAGDSFGEEALLTDSVRNATVRMASDGLVVRLSRDYFVELISSPLVLEVSHPRAEDLMATGARWVDVRLREEFERDGLDDAINIPLGELRARAAELPSGGSFVTYCNHGRRALAGAFLMSQRGIHAASLRGGIAGQRPQRRGIDNAAERLASLRSALLDVNAELDRALREQAEADAARDVEQRLSERSSEEAEAEARLGELRDRSSQASDRLRDAMGRKRELESRVREVEANEVSRRRAAEAQCEQMRADAERRLEEEKQRLSDRYQQASEQLRALEEARREAERRFEAERERMEREMQAARAQMEAEVARIRDSVENARRDAENRASGIREEYTDQERQLRQATEQSLREERGRLEEEFTLSVAAQEQARHELDQAEAAREEAERESEQLRQAADARLAEQRAEEHARREAEIARLRAAADEARSKLELAEARRAEAQRDKEDYSRTLTENPEPASSVSQAKVREELGVFERALASADDAVERAQREHEEAAQAQTIAEETAAAADARAEELRLRIYEEMEEWISDEEARSRDELKAASRYAGEIERIQSEKEARRVQAVQATESMFSDIQQMLDGTAGEDSISEMMRSRIEAEEKARLIQRARKEATDQLRKARAAASGTPDEER